MVSHSRQGKTSRPIHRFPESRPILHLFHLLLEWCAFQATLFTASRATAQMTVATLGAASRADDLHAITVRTGESIMFFHLSPVTCGDSVPAYSSHIAPTRQSVVTEACRDLKPRPLLSVAGVMISPPGAATHRKVARWFNGISRTSVFEV